MAATAVEAWDERWTTPEGRADWLAPHPAVAALVPVLKARGTQHVLAAAFRPMCRSVTQSRPTVTGVNAGEKMHQRAGVKLHHGWVPERSSVA
jgi:hypothetical protein